MAELLPSERLQPCLLDRLTDDEPDSRREGRERRVISMRQYRAAVLRDISWLLNSRSLTSVQDISDYEEVESSVLNYGTPDLCGMTLSGLDAAEIEMLLRRAIANFEPRVLPQTLAITAVPASDDAQTNALSFEIKAELWAQPANEALLLRTDLDLETGEFRIG